jgi:hypothetical protein
MDVESQKEENYIYWVQSAKVAGPTANSRTPSWETMYNNSQNYAF